MGARGRLPVEVIPFAEALALARLEALGCPASRRTDSDGAPFVTDNGNLVLDAKVSAIAAPGNLDRQVLAIPGVLGTGLFVDMADAVIVQDGDDVDVRRRPGAF